MATVTSTGSYLPENVITNKEFEQTLDTSDEWIRTKLGIKKRRFLRADQTTSDLAAYAARDALRKAGVKPEDVELIILATTTPDMIAPSTACILQGKLGAVNAAAFDVMNFCSGFNYALAVASKFVGNECSNALVVAAEAYSRFLDFSDRRTCVIFGDGAGAVLLEDGNRGVFFNYLRSDGTGFNIIQIPGGGAMYPASVETVNAKLHTFKMDGRGVWDFATKFVPKEIKKAFGRAKMEIEDCDFFIFHQANLRIIREIMKTLGIPEDKTHTTIEEYGNTASASIPITLDDAVKRGKVRRGDIVALIGFGGGLAWGINLIEW
ncbi:3-oxoacyl-ACP synthase III family protein [Archaeoglobus veneficus]|uniref:3-oxoacyl-(Acyl-carrier-protein) synthase 3 n=1 Tax=Archaeoglobus veneficus (strain DSM 11195 / SNP6) TaxID=693661 RepID=F2KRW9_ARCVS|nr:beta-ketoacyl-ACP synthase III [Archaeoglobus veneficus]AEA46810.1 3-oxoacyl-(acyl-carrier-protein) synthase 3 [Archaeoglobus veneficus SNP6]